MAFAALPRNERLMHPPEALKQWNNNNKNNLLLYNWDMEKRI